MRKDGLPSFVRQIRWPETDFAAAFTGGNSLRLVGEPL